ncbi:MAG: hypothetical protein A4E65_01070 [Syntrophorhabdus sp. PtaU1.Bin153]|nr:MAG: hypothetical protein A4E65_01070 [Syntrophorhabdus sp. PtaU1.Bin153]
MVKNINCDIMESITIPSCLSFRKLSSTLKRSEGLRVLNQRKRVNGFKEKTVLGRCSATL